MKLRTTFELFYSIRVEQLDVRPLQSLSDLRDVKIVKDYSLQLWTLHGLVVALKLFFFFGLVREKKEKESSL